MGTDSGFCKKAKDWFSPYFDEVLPRKDRSKLEEHFRVCSSCQKSYESYKALLVRVRALPEIRPSAHFEARLFARIRSEGATAARASWWQDIARIPLPVPLGAAALVLIAVFAYTRMQGDRSPAGPEMETASRHAPADSVPLRSNTRPAFLGDIGRPGDIGMEASAGLVGPPYPMNGHLRSVVFVVPCDLNGIPLEGPYEPAAREETVGGTRGASEDSAGRVDTSLSGE